jgi:hypothetical protein
MPLPMVGGGREPTISLYRKRGSAALRWYIELVEMLLEVGCQGGGVIK